MRVDLATGRQRLGEWARWRHIRVGGFGETILSRLLDGMKSTRCPACMGHKRRMGRPCPTCNGEGTIKLEERQAIRVSKTDCPDCRIADDAGVWRSTGEVNGKACLTCRGSGVKVVQTLQINPALIRSTYVEPSNATCERVDTLIGELKTRPGLQPFFAVVSVEYIERFPGATQEKRAARLRITRNIYAKRLIRVTGWVALGLVKPWRAPRAMEFPSYRELMESGDTGCRNQSSGKASE